MFYHGWCASNIPCICARNKSESDEELLLQHFAEKISF